MSLVEFLTGIGIGVLVFGAYVAWVVFVLNTAIWVAYDRHGYFYMLHAKPVDNFIYWCWSMVGFFLPAVFIAGWFLIDWSK